jgi:hypothetical protein
MSTKSAVFKSWFFGGLQPPPPPVCYWYCHTECAKDRDYNNAHKIVHIGETLFWKRNGRFTNTKMHFSMCICNRKQEFDAHVQHSSSSSLGSVSLCPGCTSALGLLWNPKYSNQYRFNNPVLLIKKQRSLTEGVLIAFSSISGFPKTSWCWWANASQQQIICCTVMYNITITSGTRVMKCDVIQIKPVIISQLKFMFCIEYSKVHKWMSLMKQIQRDEAEEQEELSSLCTQSPHNHRMPWRAQ